MQELLQTLNIKGQTVVADDLNCQKETAEIIAEKGADYLLCAKDNHPNLKKDIEDFVQDKALRSTMKSVSITEKNYGRIEKRMAFVCSEIDWLERKKEWKDLCCIGAIHTEFESKKGKASEWHYYISYRALTANELLHHARMEWSVESMHWLLDVHFEEDWCRVEDKAVQQHFNMFRKAAINLSKLYKSRIGSKDSISGIMLECLIDNEAILRVVEEN